MGLIYIVHSIQSVRILYRNKKLSANHVMLVE